MITDQHLAGLVDLVRQRYPDWEDVAHPGFAADELAYKRAAAAKAQAQLSRQALDDLIAAEAFDDCLARLERLGNDTNLLWRRVPSAGDTAVLNHPHLDKATFCTQLRNLLHGDRPAPQRLQSFSDYLASHDLPNGWPFPTYFLFLLHPETELFVKPRAAHWFLRYVGETAVTVTTPPTADTYARLREHARDLLAALAEFGAQDLIDVQSILWVAHRESRARAGRLDARGQVELEIPPASAPAPPLAPAILREAPPAYAAAPAPLPPLSRADLAAQTGCPPAEIDRWLAAVARKGQAVFYGPPGTGKTHVAGLLAQHLATAAPGDGLVELVQFHPAYAYEDFVQGIRPVVEAGQLRYEMQNGRLLDFCQRAAARAGTSVLIVDELNRANVAAVFGELLLLLEYRDRSIPLAGGGRFALPANVRLLGTMNTADRAIALVDHALRRRFAFIPLWPSPAALRHYHAQHATGYDLAPLLDLLADLNAQLEPHYQVGHTFFMQPDLAAQLPDIWRMEIEPYLEEYFYNQPERVAPFRWEAVEPRLSGQKWDADKHG